MKKCLPKIAFPLFALLFSAIAYSQDKVHITGTVTGENDAPTKKSILVFSYVGFYHAVGLQSISITFKKNV